MSISRTLKPMALSVAILLLATIGVALILQSLRADFSVFIDSWGLALATAGISLVYGTIAAWVIARCNFPGRLLLSVLLALPMAMPSIVVGYVLVALYDYGGAAQNILQQLGLVDTPVDIRNKATLVFVYVAVFYPYVYLAALSGFVHVSTPAREAAASLGAKPLQVLRRVELPYVLPYALGGTLLVMCETVSDYGVATLFATETFSTWVVKRWVITGDLYTAILVGGLVAVGLLAMFGLVPMVSRALSPAPARRSEHERITLSPVQTLSVYASLGLVALLVVVAPLVQLVVWGFDSITTSAVEGMEVLPWSSLWQAVSSTALLAVAVAFVAVCVALVQAEFLHDKNPRWRLILDFPYAVPAVVVGLFVVWVFTQWFGIVASGMLAMLCALVLRYFPVAQRLVTPARAAVSPPQMEVAASLGYGKLERLVRLGLPSIRPAILLSLLLVVVEVTKDIPIVLLTRSSDFSTLSLVVFELVQESWWKEAAVPALILTLLSITAGLITIRRAVAHNRIGS